MGPHPFPAGLNDCAEAVEYVHANKSKYNIGKLIVLGGSGGANLALATALKLKLDGKNNLLDGCFAA